MDNDHDDYCPLCEQCEHGIENCVYCNDIVIDEFEVEQAFTEYLDSLGVYPYTEGSEFFKAGVLWILKKLELLDEDPKHGKL